jgi:hypothetical protein
VPVCVLSGLYCWVYGILCTIKKTWVIGAVLSLCTCLCFVFNYLLIPACSWFGAILATTAAYLLCMTALSLVALKSFRVEFEWNRLFAVLMTALSLLFLSIISFNMTSYASYVAVVLMPVLPFVFGFFGVKERTAMKSSVLGAFSWNRKRVRA